MVRADVRIVAITGAAGFLGGCLCARLRAADYEVIGIDQAPGADIVGDISDPAIVGELARSGFDALVHLATIPGGGAEDEPARAKRVNLDATMALAAGAASIGARFIFASSVAVFGAPLPAAVDDDTPVAPRLLYGAHKAMAEQWLETLARRGELAALSLRFPGIVARPPGASGLKSAFMSEVFHALAEGRRFAMPVGEGATMWLMSVDRAAANLQTALEIDAAGTRTLPALRVRARDLVDEIARQAGAPAERVAFDPDPGIEAAFGAQPRLRTPAAEALGFPAGETLAELVTKGLGR